MTKKYPKWFYGISVLIPIIFVVILEIILSSFNYGTDYKPFVTISEQFENYKFFNPKLPQKYFGNKQNTPAVIPDGFEKIKRDNIYRIFVLGGSTTAGFPHPPNGSFPRLLKKMLNDEFTEYNWEVINLGISAINTITIRDIIDDVILEKPDLIIIYAGHNEYYGAFGPASNVSTFYNLTLTRILLELKEFKVVQLIENFLASIISLIRSDDSNKNTLMSEIAGENLVTLNSDSYYNGIEQFEENISFILAKCSENRIPTMIGTLASNLQQQPLCKFSGCDSLVNEFKSEILNLNNSSKEKLYLIKDKDQLRFRAPEIFNQIIFEQSKYYNTKVFDVKKSFENNSPFGIIGDNLMMDHLHPTLSGNRIIANIIFDEIKKSNLIKTRGKKEPDQIISGSGSLRFDSYTELDSTFAFLRILHLKNDFPFSKPHNGNHSFIFHSKNIVDSTAFSIINGNISWENAHLRLANYYLKNRNFKNYGNEMNVLIEDKPFDKFAYLTAINNFDKFELGDFQLHFLNKYHNYFNDYYSSLKLGQIYNERKNFALAKHFYEKCLTLSNNDPEVYFNLSAIYFSEKNFQGAFDNIKKCLSLDPDYPNAKRIFNGLRRMKESNPNN